VATLSATDREKQLKQQGLRDVKVGMEIAKLSASIDLIYKERIFKIAYSDPHPALSFDRLHFNQGGSFNDHIWRKRSCISIPGAFC